MPIIISFTKKQLILSFCVIIIILATFLSISLSKPRTTYNFYGIELKFRSNLKEADKIPVYPDSEMIYDIIWNQIENLTIVYVNSSDNSIVAIEAVEITYKMELAYLIFNMSVNIAGREISSYENLTTSSQNPVIALVPPCFTNETFVKAENGIIYIKGKDFKDFDLATTKFLMAALNISL